MTPERMDSVVGPAKRHLTGFEWLWAYFTHTAHHRGQAEVYLRLLGHQASGLYFLNPLLDGRLAQSGKSVV